MTDRKLRIAEFRVTETWRAFCAALDSYQDAAGQPVVFFLPCASIRPYDNARQILLYLNDIQPERASLEGGDP